MKFNYKHIKVKQTTEIMPGIPSKHPVHKIYSTGGKKPHLGVIVYDDTLLSFMFLPTEFFFFYPMHLEEILDYMKELKVEKELLTIKCLYCGKHQSEEEDMELYEIAGRVPLAYIHWNKNINRGCSENKENISPSPYWVITKINGDGKKV